jgi:hypothetical protein
MYTVRRLPKLPGAGTPLGGPALVESMVKTTDAEADYQRLCKPAADRTGLGIELNDDVVKAHLHATDKSYFAPTPQWNEKRSHDRIFS